MPDESTESPQGTGGAAEDSSPVNNPFSSTSGDGSETSTTEDELFDIYAQEITIYQAISSRTITIYQSMSTMGVGGILPLKTRTESQSNTGTDGTGGY